jgi:hypothetical protein
MKTHTLAAMTATLNAGACSAQAADIEFWYGNTGVVEAAINAQCAAFRAPQTQDRITCVGQGRYEINRQKPIAPHGQIVAISVERYPARGHRFLKNEVGVFCRSCYTVSRRFWLASDLGGSLIRTATPFEVDLPNQHKFSFILPAFRPHLFGAATGKAITGVLTVS